VLVGFGGIRLSNKPQDNSSKEREKPRKFANCESIFNTRCFCYLL